MIKTPRAENQAANVTFSLGYLRYSSLGLR